MSLCRVATVKSLIVHRYSVSFILTGLVGLLGSDVRKQNTAEVGTGGREGCCLFQYLS